MSENIKTTTVDQLPEDENINELYMFGYNPKRVVGQRSVKVPFAAITPQFNVSQIVGTSLTKAPSEKAVNDELKTYAKLDKNNQISIENLPLASEETAGLVTPQQLKVINEITDGMKTTAERYEATLVTMLKNEKENEQVDIANLTGVKLEYLIENDAYGMHVKREDNLEATISPITSKVNDIFKLHINGLTQFILGSNPNIRVASFSCSSRNLTHFNAIGSFPEIIDLTNAPYVKKFYGSQSKAKEYHLHTLLELETLSSYQCPNLESVRAHGAKLVVIQLNDCSKLVKIEVSKLDNLKTLILKNCGLITKEVLMDLENKWRSRAGMDTGSVSIDQKLYEELTTEEKKRFTDKNITIQF